MSQSTVGFKKPLSIPDRCSVCRGRGVVMGVFHELDCAGCDGVGWLPSAGRDLTVELGRMLTKLCAHNRVLEMRIEQVGGAERDYKDSPRDGARGHFTGD